MAGPATETLTIAKRNPAARIAWPQGQPNWRGRLQGVVGGSKQRNLRDAGLR